MMDVLLTIAGGLLILVLGWYRGKRDERQKQSKRAAEDYKKRMEDLKNALDSSSDPATDRERLLERSKGR